MPYNVFCCVSSSDMLQVGKSKPWPQALKKLTRSETVDVGALTEYFQPLRDWLVKQRQEIGYAGPGWEEPEVTPTAGVPSLVPALFSMFAVLFSLVVFFC